MKANGAYAALRLGGSIGVLRVAVAQALGVRREPREYIGWPPRGGLTGDVGVPILGRQAKVDALEEINRGGWV